MSGRSSPCSFLLATQWVGVASGSSKIRGLRRRQAETAKKWLARLCDVWNCACTRLTRSVKDSRTGEASRGLAALVSPTLSSPTTPELRGGATGDTGRARATTPGINTHFRETAHAGRRVDGGDRDSPLPFPAGIYALAVIAKFHYTDTDTGPTRTRTRTFLRRNSVGSVRVRFAAKKSVSVSV